MTPPSLRWTPVSETSGLITVADAIDVSLAPYIGALSQRIKDQCPDVSEVTPSFTTILVETRSLTISLEQIGASVLDLARNLEGVGNEAPPQKIIELPAYYAPEVGPDLEAVAQFAKMSVEEVVELHANAEYTVCAMGFAPGFAFLAEVDERIAIPRHDNPRSRVPAGSVGIADKQTGVYPAESPGGWHLIGNCPIPLYQPHQDPPSPFRVGDRVRFVPIDRDAFLKRGGHV